MKMYIKKLQEAYYKGKPLVSDEQYDAIIATYGDDEEEIGPPGDQQHLNPMYSLKKLYPGRGDTVPHVPNYIKTAKIDGAALELIYNRVSEDFFVLESMNTRGSVTHGQKVNHVRHAGLKIPTSFELPNVPSHLNKIQITGEVGVCAKVDNARNLASGKLQLDDDVEFLNAASELNLRFFAYNLLGSDQTPICDRYYSDLMALSSVGFTTVLDSHKFENLPFDGEVYREDNNAEFFKQGFTAKFPRAAFAVKTDKDYVVTTLLDVEWNVGRTGKVVPTAIVEPINIEGAVVSRATLNNPRFIEAMGLYTGCKVRLIRSGEIIPCIIGLHPES